MIAVVADSTARKMPYVRAGVIWYESFEATTIAAETNCAVKIRRRHVKLQKMNLPAKYPCTVMTISQPVMFVHPTKKLYDAAVRSRTCPGHVPPTIGLRQLSEHNAKT